MNIQTIFENENFLVVDKEAMVLTTPAREGLADPRPCLGLALQTQLGQQIFPVHRLDFEVSGLVIFAKNAKAHSQANTWFEKKTVQKVYQALGSVLLAGSEASGRVPSQVLPKQDEEVRWRCLLLRGKRRSYEHAIGKPTETLAIYRGPHDSHPEWHRFELYPLTGRPHQLRYELYRHGYPIVGDELYSSSANFTSPGIVLWACKINFTKAPSAKDLGLPPALGVPGLF